ncbi:hypothetical protein HKD37_16G045659 [Glycine soja]
MLAGPCGGVDHRKSDLEANIILQPDAVPIHALPLEPEVGPSAARASTKGSCVDPLVTDPDTGDSDKCGLYIKENPSRLVTLGRVYEGSTVAHNILYCMAKQLCLQQNLQIGRIMRVFNQEFPLYIKHEDLSEIAHNDQCLSISRSGQSQFESKSYMKSWMQNSKHDVYLGAYLNGALKELDDTPQPKSKAGARWIIVKCNRQKGSTECGYYVMH